MAKKRRETRDADSLSTVQDEMKANASNSKVPKGRFTAVANR